MRRLNDGNMVVRHEHLGCVEGDQLRFGYCDGLDGTAMQYSVADN